MAGEPHGSRARTWLTFDLGNTALDAVAFDLVDGRARVRAVWRGVTELEALLDQLAAADRPAGVSLCSVRGARTEAIVAGIEARLGPVLRPACGLELDLETPATTGQDRLFAARAASALSQAAIVVDAGTAMTVDLVVGGAFLGGAIAPGARTLARSLAERGAQLFEIEPRPGVSALGRSTQAALEAGVVVGLRGAARELVKELLLVAAARGGGAVDGFVAGGDRALLLEPTPCFDAGLRALYELPLAVHLGLLLASVPGVVLPADSARPVA